MPKKKKALPIKDMNGLLCARYGRCSTDDQRDIEYSTVDVQDAQTARYMDEHSALDAAFYGDDGWSGTTLERPAFQRLLADAKAGRFTVVLCTYLSRLGRGEASTVAEYLLREAGVTVLYVNERFGGVGKDPDASMDEYILKEATRFGDGLYVQSVVKQTISTMSELHREGFHVGGRIPFGYLSVEVPSERERKHRRLIPNPDTALFVEEARKLFLSTRSKAEVKQYLESVTGKPWCYTAVDQILTARYYIGETEWRGIVANNVHPAIAEVSTHNAVQELLASTTVRRARQPVETAAEPYAYHLRGILSCACGKPMTTYWVRSRSGAIVRYYSCRNSACTHRYQVNATHLHDSLLAEFDRCVQHPWRVRDHIERAAKLLPEPNDYGPQISALESRLRQATKVVKGLTDAVAAAPGAALTVLLHRLAKEEEARASVEEELTRLRTAAAKAKWRPTTDQLLTALSYLTQVWEGVGQEMRSALMTRLVESARLWDKNHVEVSVIPLLTDLVVRQEKGSMLVKTREGDSLTYEPSSAPRVPLLIEISKNANRFRSLKGDPRASSIIPNEEEVSPR